MLLRAEEQKVHWWQYHTETPWSPSKMRPVTWKVKELSARRAHSLTILFGQCENLVESGTNSRVWWPEWSHAATECYRARHVRTSTQTGVEAAEWYATNDIVNVYSSTPLAVESRAQFSVTGRGIRYPWNCLPQGWKHSPVIYYGLIPKHCNISVTSFYRVNGRSLWERKESNSMSSESQFCHQRVIRL